MPRYDFVCQTDKSTKFTLSIQISDYKPEINCPCGTNNCVAKRVFNSFVVQNGLTANEKKFGTTSTRKEMSEFVKDQRDVRKSSYSPDSRESKSNELWTGKEGLDGITTLPVQRKD
jgi:hypothetical protein